MGFYERFFSEQKPSGFILSIFLIIMFFVSLFFVVLNWDTDKISRNFNERNDMERYCHNNNMSFLNLTRHINESNFYCRQKIKTVDKCWNITEMFIWSADRNVTECNHTISYKSHLFEYKNKTIRRIERLEINMRD